MQIQAQETMNERLKERMPEAPTTGKIYFLTTYYLNNNWLFLNKIKIILKLQLQIQAEENMHERLKERMPEVPTTGKIYLLITYYLNIKNWLFLNKIKIKLK